MTDGTPKRAHSMAEFRALMGRMMAPVADAASFAPFAPRPSDIVISPYGKCGTTWLQQTFHTLRTGGDMDFDDISRVVPWIETAPVLQIDLNAEQRAEPRGFKSHLSYAGVPKGARYVVSLRDPQDAFVSMFRFMEGWWIEPGTVPMADFFEGWLHGGPEGGGYFAHLLSWWDQRNNPDVLLLSYGAMIDAPAQHIRKLAGFCGIAIDDALLALTLERSSISYMLAHKDRFDDAMQRSLSETKCNLPPGSDSAKVRRGGVGLDRKELTADLAARIDAAWAAQVAPHTGLADFAAFEAALKAA
ncbi:MAG: sulfotransferase domain-containing protein [Sandarakinorhabdus sp.]|nr:sulfotransferase domain-containing protein [Sandarakinorhabdus sp.]